MKTFERFAELYSHTKLEDWYERICHMINDFGYTNFTVIFMPDGRSGFDAKKAFYQTNYPQTWCNKYLDEELQHIDPVNAHCLTKTTPLVWSPDKYKAQPQRDFFEEAASYGIRSGISFPAHGPDGQHGAISFASAEKYDNAFRKNLEQNVFELSFFRHFIFETSLRFVEPTATSHEDAITVTPRELECLKWSAIGKSSWDIAQIMNCSEAGINAHFSRILKKFGTSSRIAAVVKAIRMGIIIP